uniref:rRNA biogenesis protein RRP36 n=1 Tax=Oryzias sinensis TaxID=183150 RepID=A0A8C7ZLX1_9TELE
MRVPSLLPHVHYHLLCLVCVEGEVVVLTPCHQTGHLPPVGCFVPASDASYHRGVVSELQDDVVLMRGRTVVGEQGVEDGAENTALLCANVRDDAGRKSRSQSQMMGCIPKGEQFVAEFVGNNQLSTMSFEEILKLQNKVGTKVYNEVAYNGGGKSQRSSKKKRLNKNRPMEISAKKPAPFLRQVVPIKKPVVRDPRFDDLSGEYKPEIYEQTYKFINDIKHREKEVRPPSKKLKKTKKNNQKEKLQFLLKRLENQERARQNREKQRERELQFKREQRERADQGARPFFLKKSDKKKLELAEKYQDLKKSGKLDTFLSKKRKRNAGKDRKKLPKEKS